MSDPRWGSDREGHITARQLAFDEDRLTALGSIDSKPSEKIV